MSDPVSDPAPPADTSDPLYNQADTLVLAANVFAVGALPEAKNRYPFLKTAVDSPDDHKWWNIVLTIAAVYIAATRLRNLELGEPRENALMAKVTEHLIALNPNALVAFDDCKEFFGRNFDALVERGHEERYTASDSIGLWITWNLLDRAPNVETEWAFVRGVGVLTTHTFFTWWDHPVPATPQPQA